MNEQFSLYSVSQDGSRMFIWDLGKDNSTLYTIDLKSQVVIDNTTILTSKIFNCLEKGLYFRMTYVYLKEKNLGKVYMQFYPSEKTCCVKIQYKGGSSDNVTLQSLNFLDDGSKSITTTDVSVYDDSDLLTALSEDGKIHIFELNGNDNVTSLVSDDFIPESSSSVIGLFLRTPAGITQTARSGKFYFVYLSMNENEEENFLRKINFCTATYDMDNKSLNVKCDNYTNSILVRDSILGLPLLPDFSGFVTTSEGDSKIQGDYLTLRAVTINEFGGNVNQKWFTLYPLNKLCDIDNEISFDDPLILAGNTLYGTYCVHARSNLERMFVPNNDDVNYCKIFYVKSTD